MKKLKFGDYCVIGHKRFGVENKWYTYKVISRDCSANYYKPVPVCRSDKTKRQPEMIDVVRVIRCGVDETKVETFRMKDVGVGSGI